MKEYACQFDRGDRRAMNLEYKRYSRKIWWSDIDFIAEEFCLSIAVRDQGLFFGERQFQFLAEEILNILFDGLKVRFT